MRVLVTGAAGFIGSTTAELLIQRGHDVVALDNLSKGRIENVPAGASFVEGDCANQTLVEELGYFDACVHFAGRIEPAQSITHPEEFFANNVGSTFALTLALIRSGVKRFVFSSSAAVYGKQSLMPIDEDRPCSPESPYGQSKRMVEEGLHWLASSGKLNVASMRYFNAAGGTRAHPERHVPEIHLIPLALDVVLGVSDHLDLFGDDYPTPDGTCIRDYVHVLDLAEAHVRAIEVLGDQSEVVVNLGSGVGYSNREVIESVRRVTGANFDVRAAPRRIGDPAVAVADTSRAQSLLGWSAVRSDLDTVVRDAWEARQAVT
ncbi:MAG: UDP-glucose 4-epimerase GalE [Acidimicrobiales bacterium]